MLPPPFVGDGQRDITGAAEETTAATAGAAIFYPPAPSPSDLIRVRTRGDLADLIKSAADPVLVKQEEIESWQGAAGGEGMELDEEREVEFIREFDGDEYSVYYGDEGEEEEDESLLEEQEYEEQEEAGETRRI
jgi:hypothetical protein